MERLIVSTVTFGGDGDGDGDGEFRLVRGTLEQVLQMRRWRWRRSTGAGALIVQFYLHQYTKPETQNSQLTLQTTLPHLLHPPTISLAQSPTFPLPETSLPASTKYQSAARALYRNVCSGSSFTSSFSQCRVEVISCVRN